MKEFVTAIAVASILPQVQGQALFTYDFTGSDPAGDLLIPPVEHLILSPFGRINVGAVSQSDVFSSSYWSTGATCDPTEYVYFTLQPEPGYSVRLESLLWDSSRSATGPQTGKVSLLKDGNLLESSSDYVIGTTMASYQFDFEDVVAGPGQTIEFRFHGWNATSTGNLRLDNVSAIGQITPVPEPRTLSAITAGGLVMLAIHRRVRTRTR